MASSAVERTGERAPVENCYSPSAATTLWRPLRPKGKDALCLTDQHPN